MGKGQEKSNSRLLLLVFFLLGAAATFLVFRLGDVYGWQLFHLPMNAGPWDDPPPYPASPPSAPRPSPATYRPPEPVTYRPVSTPRPTSTIAPVTKPPSDRRRVVDMRLPRNIWPKNYTLSVQTFLSDYGVSISPEQKNDFAGNMTLTFENKQPLKKIVLNQRDLAISRHQLTTADGKPEPIKTVTRDDHLEFVTFELEKEIPPGIHHLYIEYKGKMKGNVKGLYLSRDGNRYVAATQMEPYDARAMMPCLDEPEYKAPWTVSVIHPKGSMALGNEMETSVVEKGDWKTTSFASTPVMSSYLVAIFVGNYTYLEDHTERGLRVRVYAMPKLISYCKWALEVAVKAMNTFEKLYKIPYPVSKLDNIFIADFKYGAMENWGLVTYSNYAILYEEGDGIRAKKTVADVVAHELGHQWFGNLVTMAWWSHLWLNEGWATFNEFIGTQDAWNSSYLEHEYYLGFIWSAMNKDLDAGRSQTFEMEEQEQIGAILDEITYKRGGSLIAMLKELLGKEIFDQGVVNYLTKYQYKNVKSVDFFREFDAVVPTDKLGPNGKRLNVTDFMLRYTVQEVFPIVYVKPHNSSHWKLSQKKFGTNREDPANPYGYKWDIPIYILRGDKRNDNVSQEFYWLPAGQNLFIPRVDNETFVVNADSYVYGIVRYEDSHWKEIGRLLKANHTMFSKRARARLLSDARRTGAESQVNQFVETGSYLFKNEDDYLPFATFLKDYREMESEYGQLLKDSSAKFLKAGLETRVKEMDIRETANRIVDFKTFDQERLSLLLYTEYCGVAPEECQSELAGIFVDDFLSKCEDDQMASNCSTVPAEIRQQVYCAGVQSEGDEAIKMLTKMQKIEENPVESERLLLATLCSPNKKFVWKSLAGLGVKQPTKATSLLVDNGLGTRIVADYVADSLYQTKSVHEKRPSLASTPRRFRQFGAQYETMENIRKAVSKAVDNNQKMMEGVDVEKGRQLAKTLDQMAQQFVSL